MVFALAPEQSPRLNRTSPSLSSSTMSSSLSEPATRLLFLQAMIEGLIDGVMIVTDRREVLQANLRARQICRKLNTMTSPTVENTVAEEIWRVCHALMESRELFPEHVIIPDSEIELRDGSLLRIRAQWLNLAADSGLHQPNSRACMLVTLEDRQQSIQNLAIADIQKFDLTPREGQVWQLRLAGRSYKDIAAELFITENTVKKHVKSILAKRRVVLEDEEFEQSMAS